MAEGKVLLYMYIHGVFCWIKATLGQQSLCGRLTRKGDPQEVFWAWLMSGETRIMPGVWYFSKTNPKDLFLTGLFWAQSFGGANLFTRTFFGCTLPLLIIIVRNIRCAHRIMKVLRGTKTSCITSEMIFVKNKSVRKNGIETSASAEGINVTETSSIRKITRIFKEISMSHLHTVLSHSVRATSDVFSEFK